MSQTNAELVRAAYQALSRQDPDRLMELLDEDVEFRNPDYAIEPGTRHGRAAFMHALERGWEAIQEVRYEIDEIVDEGDVIVVTGTARGRGVRGGVPVETAFGHVLELRDGRATSVAWFQDPAEAFAAAGISRR
jgi:ketosteroid isomerase-like protein